MNSNEYQELAARTLIDGPQQPLTAEELFMAVTLLRMHSSLGWLTEVFKKNILHRHREYDLEEFELDMEMLGNNLKSLSELPHWKRFPKDFRLDAQNTMVLWNIIGLLGEASEIARLEIDHALKPLPQVQVDLATREEWTKELGDVAWYHSAIATKLGLQLSDIQEANIDKLKKRFPEGFTTEDSMARVDVGSEAKYTAAKVSTPFSNGEVRVCQVQYFGEPQDEYSKDQILWYESEEDLYAQHHWQEPYCILTRDAWMAGTIVGKIPDKKLKQILGQAQQDLGGAVKITEV